MTLKQQALRGIIWSAIERFSVQGIQFILSFIIARQLYPSDYGLIAMLTFFMAVAQSFVDSGFSNALLQKQDRTQIDLSTVFYFNIAISIIAYFILILLSPFISNFYNQPILEHIIVLVGLNLIIGSISTIQRTILTIELNFKKQAIISFLSVLISGTIAVYMAYNDYGVWTLVYQGLLNGLINAILLWCTTRWFPSIVFSIQSFKQLFSFGSKILISGLLHTIYVNLYSLVIGKLYSAQDLGYYNRAHSTALYPSSNIVSLTNRVVYPILCRLQKNDIELTQKYFTFLRLTLFIVFPTMTGLAVMAEPIIKLLLTDKWLECVPYLQILCVAYMWDPIMNYSCGLINAKGRSDLYLRAEIIKKVVALLILLFTISFGLKAICIGLIFYSFFDIIIITSHVKIVIQEVNIARYIYIMLPILTQSILMCILVHLWIIYNNNLYAQVGGGIIIGICSYFLLSFIINRKLIHQLLVLLKRE